jgi:hypothetical protein
MTSGGRRSPPHRPEPCDGVAMEAVSDPVLSLSDKDIQDKIERLTTFASGNRSSSLRDKGKKGPSTVKATKGRTRTQEKPSGSGCQ